jgi:hypothetical protein
MNSVTYKCSVYDKPALKKSVTCKFIADKVINKCSVYDKPALRTVLLTSLFMIRLLTSVVYMVNLYCCIW